MRRAARFLVEAGVRHGDGSADERGAEGVIVVTIMEHHADTMGGHVRVAGLPVRVCQRFTGAQVEYLRQAVTGRVTHNLLAGIEISELTDEFTFVPQLLPDIDLLDPVETATEPLIPIPGQSTAADAESLIIAPYLIDQIRLSDRVQLLLGARWDTINFEEAVLDTSRDDSELNPMLGLVVGLRDGLSFYANAGTAFAPPSTFAVDADRVPEESTQYELGLKTVVGRLEGSLAFYRLERENIAIPDETGVTRQVGDQRTQGV